MNPEALKSLRDIHLPEPISWWPLAIGWWLLLGALLFLIWLTYWSIKRKKASVDKKHTTWKTVLQEAQQLWQKLSVDAKQHPDKSAQIAAECVALIRRVAVHHPNANASIAGIVGRDWLRWLDQQWDESGFNEALGSYFLQAAYQPASELDKEKTAELLKVCGQWLEAQKQWPS